MYIFSSYSGAIFINSRIKSSNFFASVLSLIILIIALSAYSFPVSSTDGSAGAAACGAVGAAGAAAGGDAACFCKEENTPIKLV